MKPLKQFIREYRLKSGLSQTELAKLAGVGKSTVFDLEQGKESIQLDTLTKILDVLNMTMTVRGPLLAGQDEIQIFPKSTNTEP